MRDTTRRLPDGELEVMQAIWSCTPPVSRTGIDAQLRDTHPMAQTTLLTVLTRLADKGFIRIDREGRSAHYTPLVSREEYQEREGKTVLEKLYGNSLKRFAAALYDGGAVSRQELAELRAYLDELGRGDGV